jgi:hypothetical protein
MVKRENMSLPTQHETPIIIAVMGVTGSGKSSFIEKVSGLKTGIGHGLKSCKCLLTYKWATSANGA